MTVGEIREVLSSREASEEVYFDSFYAGQMATEIRSLRFLDVLGPDPSLHMVVIKYVIPVGEGPDRYRFGTAAKRGDAGAVPVARDDCWPTDQEEVITLLAFSSCDKDDLPEDIVDG